MPRVYRPTCTRCRFRPAPSSGASNGPDVCFHCAEDMRQNLEAQEREASVRSAAPRAAPGLRDAPVAYCGACLTTLYVHTNPKTHVTLCPRCEREHGSARNKELRLGSSYGFPRPKRAEHGNNIY
jgi:hypothetical protein